MRGFPAIVALGVSLTCPARAQAPAPAAVPSRVPPVIPSPAQSLDSYAEAAATTIIAEQSCSGVRLNAGQLTTLRLAARIGAGQEAALEEKLRTRASQLRQQLAMDGRETWCAAASAAFGPDGTVARGVLAQGVRSR